MFAVFVLLIPAGIMILVVSTGANQKVVDVTVADVKTLCTGGNCVKEVVFHAKGLSRNLIFERSASVFPGDIIRVYQYCTGTGYKCRYAKIDASYDK